jgi:hypothetical protein
MLSVRKAFEEELMPLNTDIIERVTSLSKKWPKRQMAMQKAYRLLRLTNDLQQPNMESVISSDPRTGFNFALWLMVPKTYRFLASPAGMSDRQLMDLGQVESFVEGEFRTAIRNSRTSLRGSFLRQLVSLMLATGWYAVVSFPTQHGWVWRAWNPATVFPEYDEEGNLVEVGRIYSITGAQANQKVIGEGWLLPSRPWPNSTKVKVYNHWIMRGGRAWHSVVIGQHLAKEPTPTMMSRLPLYVGPCGGLPDDGSIMGDDSWTEDIGQSMLAPVLEVQKNYDKTLTYMQQLLRDASNPRFKFWSNGTSIDPDDWYKRGAFFELNEGEDIRPVDAPPIPAELRAHLFDLRAQVQRSQFSDISFGAVQGRISAFLMSSVTATARQILGPFEETLKAVLGDIATDNVATMRRINDQMGEKIFSLNGDPFPPLPDWVPFDFQYEIQVPGDMIQRANTARILNPSYRLPATTITGLLFPEIDNPLKEQANLMTEDAVNSNEFKSLSLIEELLRAAEEAQEVGDTQFSRRLERMAQRIESQLLQAPQQGMGPPGGNGSVPNIQELMEGV